MPFYYALPTMHLLENALIKAPPSTHDIPEFIDQTVWFDVLIHFIEPI